jgi:HlyD family secretion protein
MAEHTRKRPPVPVIVAVLLLLIGGGIWWWWSSTQPSAAASASALSGTVESTEYQVSPAIAGRITAMKVVEGDQVTKGQELVTLDQSAIRLQLDQAKQGVVAAKAAVRNAKDDDDATTADVTAAKARQKQAEAAVKLARVQLGYTVVTAPRNGTVVSVTGNAGQNAAPGKTLLTITDPADLFVRVFVAEPEIGNVTVGQAARLATDSGPAYDGTVSYIASESEFTPNNVQTKDQRVKLVYEVRVKVADASSSSGTLKAGMPVDVTLD